MVYSYTSGERVRSMKVSIDQAKDALYLQEEGLEGLVFICRFPVQPLGSREATQNAWRKALEMLIQCTKTIFVMYCLLMLVSCGSDESTLAKSSQEQAENAYQRQLISKGLQDKIDKLQSDLRASNADKTRLSDQISTNGDELKASKLLQDKIDKLQSDLRASNAEKTKLSESLTEKSQENLRSIAAVDRDKKIAELKDELQSQTGLSQKYQAESESMRSSHLIDERKIKLLCYILTFLVFGFLTMGSIKFRFGKTADTDDLSQNIVARCIRTVTYIIVCLLWSIIGIILWVPLLFRIISVYTAVVMAASFKKFDMKNSQKRLDTVITFYIDGFRRIISSFGISSDEDIISSPPLNNKHAELIIRIGGEMTWSAIFWITTYFSISHFIS